MSEDIQILLILIGIPFGAILTSWLSLMFIMRKTTGELKHWITPDNVIKGIAIIFIILFTTSLASLKIITGDVASAIFSGIIGYTLGSHFFKTNNT